MSTARKLHNIVPVQSREELIAEFKRVSDEKTVLDRKAEQLDKQKKELQAQILEFVKAGVPTQVGRFEVLAQEISRENVSIKDARSVLPKSALAKFNAIVTESSYFKTTVKIIDQVGELMDLTKESDS